MTHRAMICTGLIWAGLSWTGLIWTGPIWVGSCGVLNAQQTSSSEPRVVSGNESEQSALMQPPASRYGASIGSSESSPTAESSRRDASSAGTETNASQYSAPQPPSSRYGNWGSPSGATAESSSRNAGTTREGGAQSSESAATYSYRDSQTSGQPQPSSSPPGNRFDKTNRGSTYTPPSEPGRYSFESTRPQPNDGDASRAAGQDNGLRFADRSGGGPELMSPGSNGRRTFEAPASQRESSQPDTSRPSADRRDFSSGGAAETTQSGDTRGLPTYNTRFDPPAQPVTSQQLPHRGSSAAGPLRPLNPPTNVYGLDNQQNLDGSGSLWDRSLGPSLGSNGQGGRAAQATYEAPNTDPLGPNVARRPVGDGASLADAPGNQEPGATDNGDSEETPERPWGPLVLTSLALFASLGGNGYLAWIAWGFFTRYKMLVNKLRDERER